MAVAQSPNYTAVSPNYLSDKQIDTMEIGTVITVLQGGESSSATNATNINSTLKKWNPPSYNIGTNTWTAGYWSSNGLNYSQSPASQYAGYLYCDGSEYNIKDYPHLYFVLKNTYGGSSSITLNNVTSDGAIIQGTVSGSEYIVYLKTDASGVQVIPYDTIVVFTSLGAFSFLTSSVNYYLRLPTTVPQTATIGTETVYAYRLTDSSGNNITGGVNKTKAQILASLPTYKYTKAFTITDWPILFGTFKVPDYKAKKLVGFGPVYGSGTPTIGNLTLQVGINDELGNSIPGGYGGSWYLDQAAQRNEFSLGRVVTTGMENVIENAVANVTGQVSITINLEDKPLSAPPEHNHLIFNSQANTDYTANSGQGYDPYLSGYSTGKGGLDFFFPTNGGIQLSHAHGLSSTRITDATIATFDNDDSAGIGSLYGSAGGIGSLTLVSAGSGYSSSGSNVSVTGGSGSGAFVSWSGGTSGGLPSSVTVATAGSGYAVGNVLTVAGGSGGTYRVATIVPSGSYYAAGNALGYYTNEVITLPDLVKTFTSSSKVGGITITTSGVPTYETLFSQTYNASSSPQVVSYAGYTLDTITFTLSGGGGSGGGSTVNGNSGGSTSLTIGGTTIIAGGGGGGFAPSSPTSSTGGAGGSAGTNTAPTVTGITYTNNVNGSAGTAGNGGQGWAQNYNFGATLRTGGAGGTGLSNFGTTGTSKYFSIISGEITVGTFTTDISSYSVAASNLNYAITSVYYALNGGGGGNGYAESDGGPGKYVKVRATQQRTYGWTIGGRGSDGSYGTNSPSGGAGGVIAPGGSGGGGIPAGGSGGGGGGATLLIEPSLNYIVASAGGGGGGGGYGADGANTQSIIQGQPNPINDGVQQVSEVLFGNGGQSGNQSGCHGGGGGGGGGGVGTSSQPAAAGRGGAGGGAGHGGGYGGQRGLSSIRTDYVSLVSSGDNGSTGSTSGGSVTVSIVEDRSYWGACGGGGGGAGFVSGQLTSDFLNTITGTSFTLNVGYGGAQTSSGGDTGGAAGGNGSATVLLRRITGYTGGVVTTSIGDIIYSASTGIGSSVDATVSAAGTGISSNGGFNNGGYYVRITGPSSVLQRYVILTPVDCTQVGSIVFSVARGNGNNGGDLPEDAGDDLKVYYSQDPTSFPDANYMGTLVPVPTSAEISSGYDGTSGNTIWHNYTLDLTAFPNAQSSNMYFKIAQNRSSGGVDNSVTYTDNFGIKSVTYTYLPTPTVVFHPTSGYLPNTIASTSYTVTGGTSGITVNDIKFNLTSSIRLTPTPYLQPNATIPLAEPYHRVKYLIKAF